ncbi:MAG: hypothetical protein LDLANPLL_02269 [Turneriella sp.]|nr:hypothetical protein [Turneriella sp.]
MDALLKGTLNMLLQYNPGTSLVLYEIHFLANLCLLIRP